MRRDFEPLLQAVQHRAARATDGLLPLVCNELRALAAARPAPVPRER